MPDQQPTHLDLAHSDEWVSYCPHVNEDGSECDCAPVLVDVVERLRQIERVFNEGYLPRLPGEQTAQIRGKALAELRALIPEDTDG